MDFQIPAKGGDADVFSLVCSQHQPRQGRERFTIRKTFGGGRMFKRSYALLALLVIAGMALAACGPAASAFECTDTIGCVDISPTDPIHLA